MLLCQLGARFTIFISLPIIFKSKKIFVTEKYLLASNFYKQSTLEKFWSNILANYSNLSSHAVRFLLTFASTYWCKNGFLSLLNVDYEQGNVLKQQKAVYVVVYQRPLLTLKSCLLQAHPKVRKKAFSKLSTML